MEVRARERPHRPAAVRVMNAVGRLLERLDVDPVSLKIDAVLARAVREAGADDFGDSGFREGLGRLLASLEGEARLTLLGRLMAQTAVVNPLVSRLRLIDWRKRHPEVAGEDIRRPLFILGLPRTGTTLLHSLLDVDPANRSPLFWEVERPVPPAAPATWKTDPRIAQAAKGLAQFDRLCPGIFAVHEMAADLPQECVAILAMDMMAEQFHCMFDVPAYADWLDDQPMTRSLRFHREVLQHLQSGGVRGERWLLKSPCHLHVIDQLLDVYPDADIIHTHRDPVAVCASIGSLVALLRGIGSDAIDLKRIGRQQIDWWAKLLGRAVDQRKRLAAEGRGGQFLDLQMREIVADPIGVVERIYDRFGYVLTPAVKADMTGFMKNHPRDKYGVHICKPEDFGIDHVRDRARFAAYCEYFGVAC